VSGNSGVDELAQKLTGADEAGRYEAAKGTGPPSGMPTDCRGPRSDGSKCVTKPIEVSEILGLSEYEKARLDMRERVAALKRVRRVPVGNRISFAFDNRETVLFQIHETARVEGITDKVALQDECSVYSSMLPAPNQLSAALVIDLPEGINVRRELQRLNGLDKHTALVVGDEVVSALFEGVTGPESITPNQRSYFYLNAATREQFMDPSTPVLLKIGHPSYNAQAVVDGETRRALIEDLS
jgi:glycerol-3-phosphate dehydrogenase subunit C